MLKTEQIGQGSSSAAIESSDDSSVRIIRLTVIRCLLMLFAAMLVAAMVTSGSSAGTVFVLGSALSTGGFIVGLLFSMPKARNDLSSVPGNKPSSESSSENDYERQDGRLYSLNTNLQEISDWLTKMIVGIGLVESQRLTTLVWQSAIVIGASINQTNHSFDADSAATLAGAMIVGFPLVGFLTGFFSVRLFIVRAVYAADKDILRSVYSTSQSQAIKEQWERRNLTPGNAPIAPLSSDNENVALIDAALSTPTNQLRTTSDLVTHGRAALLKGRYQEAASAFARALQQGANEPGVQLDYARVLMRSDPRPWGYITRLLEDARRQIDDNTPLSTRRQVNWELMNAYLYAPSPNGFREALKLGDEYVTKDGRDDPYAYVYLAAAHGQAYSYWKKHDQETAEREVLQVRDATRRAIKLSEAEGIDDGIRRWLHSLATAPNGDDDLREISQDHPEILADIGTPQ